MEKETEELKTMIHLLYMVSVNIPRQDCNERVASGINHNTVIKAMPKPTELKNEYKVLS